jgi:hypothetical protein
MTDQTLASADELREAIAATRFQLQQDLPADARRQAPSTVDAGIQATHEPASSGPATSSGDRGPAEADTPVGSPEPAVPRLPEANSVRPLHHVAPLTPVGPQAEATPDLAHSMSRLAARLSAAGRAFVRDEKVQTLAKRAQELLADERTKALLREVGTSIGEQVVEQGRRRLEWTASARASRSSRRT